MNKKEYAKLVKEKSKNPNVVEDAFMSFLVGGLLGAIYHVIVLWCIDLFSVDKITACGYTSVLFILLAIVLTGAGVFDSLVTKFKFGLIIPITGFAHSVASSLLDYRKEGLITGLGSNMFKLAGSVILYGLVSASFLALVKVIIYG